MLFVDMGWESSQFNIGGIIRLVVILCHSNNRTLISGPVTAGKGVTELAAPFLRRKSA
jgi:hypothetical protein